MKFAAHLSKLLGALRASDRSARSTVAALPAPLIIALEPRIVYDASAASIGAAAVAVQHHTGADGQPTGTARDLTAVVGKAVAPAGTSGADAASMRAVHGYKTVTQAGASTGGATDLATIRAAQGFTDTASQAADKQVVFINSNVSDLQTLVAGLPAGTQYVVLDSTKDGLVQIEQYLQQHPGVSAIHLVSHGTAGEFQVGSTLINEADFSTYSAEFAQIGAAMKAGGDFLIYGCDVAGNADGKALVQQISSISGLNVAASTDATGAATLGGDWVLEYDAGAVHTGVIFSSASEQSYNHILSFFDETYDGSIGFDTGSTAVPSISLDGLVYTGDQPVEYSVVSGSLANTGTGGELAVNVIGAPMSTLIIQRQDGSSMAVQSFDIDLSVSTSVTVQALDSSGNTIGSIVLDTSVGATAYTLSHTIGNSVFHVDLSTSAAFSQVSSIRFVESSGNGMSLSPALDNFTYLSPSVPPTLTATSGTTSFVAGDNAASTPVVVDSGITLTDGNSSTAVSATVSITGYLHTAEDVLAFSNTSTATYGNIAASYTPSSGILMLTSLGGTASIAQWQAALRSVTYTDTAVTPDSSTRAISFQVTSDGFTPGNTTTKAVSVTDTDQTPKVTTTGSTTNYLDGAPAVTIDSGISVSDLDNATQSSGTVSVASGFHSGDTLAFTNDGSTMGNIVGSYNAGTGVLTLTSSGATATDAQWANALRAVTFASTSTTFGARTIAFATSDGTKTSMAATDIVNVVSPVQVTTDAGSAAFVAGDNTASTPVAVDTGLTVTDTAVTSLSTATVAITGNFHSAEDVLAFTNNGSTMGNIVGSYNTATGVLTLTSAGGSATLAQWQAALRSVTYTDTLVTPNAATRTVSFSVVDNLGNASSASTRTVTVTDTDQTPIVTTTGATASYVGGASAVAIDSGILVSDLDNTTQSSATVSVSGGFHSGDTLSFTNDGATMGNIQASYSAGSGVLLLTSIGATATDAQWANALKAVTFSSTSTTYGNRTIWYQINDGTKNSAFATDTVNMTAPPMITTDAGSAAFVSGDNTTSAPVVIDSGLSVTDGSATTLASATVAITGNFHSAEDVLAFTNNGSTMGNIVGSYNAATGVLTLTSTGATATLAQWQSALQSVSYTDTQVSPNTATRTISFTAVDGGGNTSATATRTVTVTATDQTPIVTTTGGTTNYVGGASAVTIDGGISVTDLDNTTQASATISVTTGFHSGDTLTFVNTSATTFGNIVGSYNAATGVLTLTSSGATAGDAQWANALSAVTFSAGSSATLGNRTISFATSDGTKTSAAATRTVDVLGPPTITTDSGSAAFVAGDNATSTPVTIDSGLALSDGAAPTLASATVAITGNFQSGQDVLAFTNTSSATYGNIAASYNAGTGVLTLSSAGNTATLAQWQAALDALTYTDTAITPVNATRTISFTVVDTAAITSNTATRTVTVTDTDQTPIVTATGGATPYLAGGPAAVVNPSVSVTDLDNATQASATVSISGNFHSGEDMLSFANGNPAAFGNIVASYNTATGVLTLTSAGATATDAQWANALSAVTFSSSGTHFGNRTVSYATSDGTKTSAAANATVAVLDRPHVGTGAGTATFVAGDNVTSTPVVVAPGLTLSDASSTSAVSATVSIAGGFHAGEDVLAFTNDGATMGDIAARYDANTGVLTLTSAGAATLDQWKAALASVTFTDTAVTPDTATRAIAFTVTDSNGIASNVQTRNVTVSDTDQTPLLTVGGGVTFTARGNGSTPVAVAPQVTISDRDNSTLTSAQVAISGGFDAANDILAFTGSAATGNIAGSYNAATGVLTLTSAGGTATLAQWTAALQSVTYSDAALKAGSSRTVTLTVSDGVKTSAVASNTVAIASAPAFPPILPSAPPPVVVTPASTHSSVLTGDDGSALPDVLDEFSQPLPIGSVPIVATMTFADPNAPAGAHSLDHTTVPRAGTTALDTGISALPVDAPLALPDVSVTMAPNDPFSIDVATLLPPSDAMHGGSEVTVRLADGRSLPGWIHYDAARGVLRGTLPEGVQDVHIVVQTRDASGHETHREVVLAPHDKHRGSHGVVHPKAPEHAALAEPSVARAAPIAARPVGKPSLDQQFAQARAALHVSVPAGAARRA